MYGELLPPIGMRRKVHRKQEMRLMLVGIDRRRLTLHFVDSLIYFHSCKVDPHWYGARTSNPWESRHSAVQFRPVCVYQTNISQKLISTIEHVSKKAEAVGSVYSTCIFFVKNSNRTWIGIFRCHQSVWNSSPLSPLKKNIITVIYHLFIIIV